jgi:hypothetical protein
MKSSLLAMLATAATVFAVPAADTKLSTLEVREELEGRAIGSACRYDVSDLPCLYSPFECLGRVLLTYNCRAELGLAKGPVLAAVGLSSMFRASAPMVSSFIFVP